jgi:hypothetical protein
VLGSELTPAYIRVLSLVPPSVAACLCYCPPQLVQEFKVALCIGRKLVFRAGSADVEVSMK